MRTEFSPHLRQDPDIAHSEGILRRCVHCGFCTATCPSYLVLKDELDSPRGRIYLIKNMLEKGRPADARTVRHIDRCLSCLSCVTTCPSGVNYMHLVDHARAHIEATYRRPLLDRLLRGILLRVLPFTWRFRLAALGGSLTRWAAPYLPGRLGALLAVSPRQVHPPGWAELPGSFPAEGKRTRRVALLAGCVQPALAPDINAATIRLLRRRGCEVVIAKGSGCCGALAHHLGARHRSHAAAEANIRAWTQEKERNGLDAVVVNASGCGTTVKDYAHMFRTDANLADRASNISKIAYDISEFVEELGFEAAKAPERLRVAYQSACSLQHGQGVRTAPIALLEASGYEVVEPREAHICCGSAGTYNLLQPKIADALRDRKAGHLNALAPDVIATGNVGCLMQLDGAVSVPIVHTVQLLDWATGGPRPVDIV